jgi:ferric-dicitrate binding protein FerR (iron transport regulator)
LNKWLGQKGSQEELIEIEKVWKISSKGQSEISPDINKEWKRFSMLREKEENASNKTRTINRTYLAIAVTITLLISVGVYLFIKSENTIEFIAASGIEKVVLPDNSTITLNKNSRISYNKGFNSEKREVFLVGEAFFQVEKSSTSFVVNTKTGVQTTVLGTQFYLRAIENEAKVELNVTEGLVAFGRGKAEDLSKIGVNESASFNFETGEVKKHELNINKLAWLSKKLKFDNTPLSEVKETLEKYFDIQIVFPVDVSELKFSGSFLKPQLKDIADVIALSFGWSYRLSEENLVFE